MLKSSCKRWDGAVFHSSDSKPARHGVVAAEFLLALPALIVILLGVVDFGRAIDAELIVANAARVGAEYAATHRFSESTFENWKESLREIVTEEGVSGNVSEELIATQIEILDPDAELKSIRVTVQLPFRFLTPWPGLSSTISLSHTVTMQQYQ